MTDVPYRNQVPSVSLAKTDDNIFAQQIGESFERYGFAIVADHGIDAALIDEAWTKIAAFFALPEDVKRAYQQIGQGGARGYTPFGLETAKGQVLHDLKEFWHIGRDLPEQHALSAYMPPNVWPAEIIGFDECFRRLFTAFDEVGIRIFSAIARFLDLAPDFFEASVSDGNSVLRLLHYPPIADGSAGTRAAAHEDINSITLLMGAQEAGLELLTREGEWLPVTPKSGELAVNIGDMLQRLTNHKLPSTTHRVVNPPQENVSKSRYSMPFFLHFRPDFLIKTLPECISADAPNRYPEPITAHDYLQQRLRELRLV